MKIDSNSNPDGKNTAEKETAEFLKNLEILRIRNEMLAIFLGFIRIIKCSKSILFSNLNTSLLNDGFPFKKLHSYPLLKRCPGNAGRDSRPKLKL